MNAFFIRIPNIVTKFQNVDILYKICYILVLSSAHARRIVSVNTCSTWPYSRSLLFATQKPFCSQIWFPFILSLYHELTNSRRRVSTYLNELLIFYLSPNLACFCARVCYATFWTGWLSVAQRNTPGLEICYAILAKTWQMGVNYSRHPFKLTFFYLKPFQFEWQRNCC